MVEIWRRGAVLSVTCVECADSDTREMGFRSVVQAAILAERPATLTIFLMARPIGNYGMLIRFLERPAPVRRCGWTAFRVKTR